MPIFEYQCAACGNVMEVLEKSTKAAAPRCTQCESQDVKKMLSGFAVGSGRPDTPHCDTCPGTMGGGSPCQGGQCPMA